MTVSANKHTMTNLHLQFFHNIHNFHEQSKKEYNHHDLQGIPKGCLAVIVGTEAEEQQKFVIPVIYINHPLFMRLLKEAEKEFGFHHEGPITIPCHVEDFRAVQGLIDKENSDHHHHHHHHHDVHHHHHHNHVWCFRVLFHH